MNRESAGTAVYKANPGPALLFAFPSCWAFIGAYLQGKPRKRRTHLSSFTLRTFAKKPASRFYRMRQPRRRSIIWKPWAPGWDGSTMTRTALWIYFSCSQRQRICTSHHTPCAQPSITTTAMELLPTLPTKRVSVETDITVRVLRSETSTMTDIPTSTSPATAAPFSTTTMAMEPLPMSPQKPELPTLADGQPVPVGLTTIETVTSI